MNNHNLQIAYEDTLLNAWEATYKQGQLTLWVMLSLHQSPKTLPEIRDYLQTMTDGTIMADDKSLYRSLRRYYDTELTTFLTEQAPGKGPPTKRYSLTTTGERVLQTFVNRNITQLIKNNELKELLS
jgi:DNA-binding PadR family transcriptional regulator